MATPIAAPINHIVITDAPRIAHKGIKIGFIVDWIVNRGWTFETVMSDYDLTRSEIHAALSYYYDHKDAIDAWIERQNRTWNELENNPQVIDSHEHLAQIRARYEEMKKAGLVKTDQDETQGHD